MPDLELIESGPHESAEVIELLGRCFESNVKMDPAVMQWQYWSNPFGTTRSWVARSKGRMVAHHAAYSVPVRFGNERLVAAIQVDTATDPGFRGRGLYGQLSEVLYASCRDDGVSVMIGNPNEEALGPLRRVGWIEVADLRLFVRPLDPAWIARRTGLPQGFARFGSSLAFPGARPSTAVVSRTVPVGLDELVEECVRGDLAAVDTGTEWWRWRFEGHPHQPYFFVEVHENGSLAAAAACGTRTEQGDVFVDLMDLVARSQSGARSVVDSVVETVPNAAAVLMTANVDGPYAAMATWAGLRLVPRRLRPNRTYFGVYPLDDSNRLEIAPWNVSLGILDYA